MTTPKPLVFAPLDSERFGLRVYRATLDRVDDRALAADIIAKQVDIAIVRTPAGGDGSLQRLGRLGMHPIHADTLVYYQVALPEYAPKPVRNTDLVFSEAGGADAEELEALVAMSFEGYRSHYHANPLLDPERILAGYSEWASGYLGGAHPDRITWIARRDGKLVAFACCSHDTEAKECEGVLFGVHPECSGGGIYGDLIRYSQARYREQHYGLMKVSTQVWNLAVQKVWNREGFALSRTHDTFHVNACLSCGDLKVENQLVFTPAQVALFAEVTNDLNPIHLNDSAAVDAGFESRISHGMLAGGELSRIFGTEFPGPGTLFLRSELAFLAPIYAGRTHTLRVRFSRSIPAGSYVSAVATVHDEAGKLCLLGYNDLLKR